MERFNKINSKFFNQAIIDEAYSFSSKEEKTKEEIKNLKSKIKEDYKKLDDKLKEEIKEQLLRLKNDFINEKECLDSQKAEALNHALEKEAVSKAEKIELSNVTKGIEISCKRAKRKAESTYFENIKAIKNKRAMLHAEYVSLLYYVTEKVSPMESLRGQYLELFTNFNFVAKVKNKKTWIGLVPLAMLLLIIIAYYIAKGQFNYQGDLSDVINKGIFVAVVATGAVFIYSQGGFDMSLGNASLMCATIAALSYNSTHNLGVSLIIAVVLGAALGIINAILATMLNLPVMVMTLTMMNILSAVHEAILGNTGGLVSVDSGMLDNPWIYALFLLLFFILCWAIFNYTKVGRRNKFIGSNKIAAKFNGINLMRAGIISFAISGIGLGICGFLFACSKSGGKYGAQTILSQVGLDVVIAIVFGGMTTSGGPRSKVSCAIIGAFFAVFLDEFFTACGAGNYSYIAKGVIFIIVSLANMWDTRGKMLASGGSIQ